MVDIDRRKKLVVRACFLLCVYPLPRRTKTAYSQQGKKCVANALCQLWQQLFKQPTYDGCETISLLKSACGIILSSNFSWILYNHFANRERMKAECLHYF